MAAELIIAPEVGADNYDYVDGYVTIYGVFHTSLDPHKWRTRLDRGGGKGI